MDITDVSPAAAVGAVVGMQQAQDGQDVQMAVLKKALEVQASGALSLLQSATGALPLASDGSLGTQINELV